MTAALFYVLIFLAGFLAVQGLALLWAESRSGARAAARERLRRIALGVQDPALQTEESILRIREVAGRSIVALANWLPGGLQLERRLYQAGMQISPGNFLALSSGLAALAWLLAWIFLNSPLIALPFAAIGLLPFYNVHRRRLARTAKFEEQFPEALDLITRAMRAGHSLLSGFQMVGEELPDPIGSEFAQVAEEIKLGQDQRIALGNLIYRVEAGDLSFFVTAISIQRETGGNLAEVLTNLGTLIRDRFALFGKVRALTAVGKASANLLALMPVLLVGLLATCGGEGGREYVKPLFTTPQGYAVAAVAAAMVLVGYVLCRRMATIEV